MLWGAHSACQWPAKDRAQLGCPRQPRAHHSSVGRALRCADGESHGDHSAPTTGRPEYGGLRKAPCRRRIARSSAARPRLAPACAIQGMLGATWRASHSVTAPIPPRSSGPHMWRAALSALLAAERAQLDCPRFKLPSAYRLFAGRVTRYANGESHRDRLAPATT